MKVILSVYSNNGERTRVEETISLKKDIENKIYAHNEIVEEVILSPNEFIEGFVNYKTQGSLNAYLLEDRCFIECKGEKHNVNLKFNLVNPLLDEDQRWKNEIIVVNRLKNNKLELGVFSLITEKMLLPYNKKYCDIAPINKKFFIATIKEKNVKYQAIIDSNGNDLHMFKGKYRILGDKVLCYKEVSNKNQFIPSSFDTIFVPDEVLTIEQLDKQFEENKERIKKEHYRREQIIDVLPKHEKK